MPQMWDDNRPADHQRHVERLHHFGFSDARTYALNQVVVDAIVAAQHHRGYQPEQFLRACVQRAVGIGGTVEVEEALDAQVVAAQDASVLPLTLPPEALQPRLNFIHYSYL